MTKRILLHVLRSPFSLIGMICAIPLLIMCFITPDLSQRFTVAELSITISITVIWFLLSALAMTFRSKYMTYIGDETCGAKTLTLLRIDSRGKVIETGNVLWGREGQEVHRVLSPFRWIGNKSDDLTVITEIVSSHDNTKTTIPVRIEVSIDGDFDWQEVYNEVILRTGKNSIPKFVAEVLMESVQRNQSSITDASKEYANGGITKDQLLEGVISVLDFPRRALSNFKNATVYLGDPISGAHKEF
jgi:hypothetical protein